MNEDRRKIITEQRIRMVDLVQAMSALQVQAEEIRGALKSVAAQEQAQYDVMPVSMRYTFEGQACLDAVASIDAATGTLERIIDVGDMQRALDALSAAQEVGLKG